MAAPRPPLDSASAHFTRRVGELRSELHSADPGNLADQTAAAYLSQQPGKGEFRLAVWQAGVVLSFPDFIASDRETRQEAPLTTQALLLYYFKTADGTSLEGRWISFSELPGGRFYNQAYQGYSGAALARSFNDDRSGFEEAASRLGGVPWPQGDRNLGDSAYLFQALPRIPLLVVFWQGDEDFPASFQILFDASASHYLPTDVCAILGGTLARKLIAARR